MQGNEGVGYHRNGEPSTSRPSFVASTRPALQSSFCFFVLTFFLIELGMSDENEDKKVIGDEEREKMLNKENVAVEDNRVSLGVTLKKNEL